jgi:hypothetical protein
MGGYGHSRLREFILGGVTRGILASMTISDLAVALILRPGNAANPNSGPSPTGIPLGTSSEFSRSRGGAIDSLQAMI